MLNFGGLLARLASIVSEAAHMNAPTLAQALSLDMSGGREMPGSKVGELVLDGVSLPNWDGKLIVVTSQKPRPRVDVIFVAVGPPLSELNRIAPTIDLVGKPSLYPGGRNIQFEFLGVAFEVGVSVKDDQIGILSVSPGR